MEAKLVQKKILFRVQSTMVSISEQTNKILTKYKFNEWQIMMNINFGMCSILPQCIPKLIK